MLQLFSFTCANLKLVSWESLGIRVQMSNAFSIFFFIFSLFSSQYSAEVYIITPSHPLTQGQTLVSPGKNFELGFFTFNNSATLYVGLWHKNLSPRKYVWVANRETPLAATDTFASLTISSNKNLELVDGKKHSVWSTNASVSSNSSSAVLLDSGNFVLKDDMGVDLWQSFDYPTDSLLPTMLLGFNSSNGKRNFLTSWKSKNDPSAGIFTVGLSAERPPQMLIWVNGSTTPHWRSGPWDKSKFIAVSSPNDQYSNPFTLDENVGQGTTYLSYSLVDTYVAYIDISSEGILRFWYSLSRMIWYYDWEAPRSGNPCDSYGACGPFGICKASESPVCKCLKGFIPKSDEEWGKKNWTGGCVRKTKLLCERQSNESVASGGKQDEFFKIEGSKVPDFHEFLELLPVDVDRSENCKTQCLNNCSCKAYAYIDNIGCLVWSKDYLIDIQEFSSGGADIFIRLAHSEFGNSNRTKLIVSLTAICFIGILISLVFGLCRLRSNNNRNRTRKHPIGTSRHTVQEHIREHDESELFLYNFDSIVSATNNFSFINILGEGGFGPVYKGKLQDGKEIAVKRLSSGSGQGIQEFKNEMLLISKLQHKNLVRIMGCCITEDEKLLIYEFMPNKSLDTLLFDPSRRSVLDWDRRFNIIRGVARGLLYLHHDSCLKVIHRDLKVSNILLDEEMNPKISDFGLARIVEGTRNVENTQKVAGTLGYMSPEYALRGIFSEKSDVYSFGVLVLEIISGRKNTSFFYNEELPSILAYAWHFWNKGRGLDLVDEVLADSYSASEVMKCVYIGLLCVQDNAADRPSMPEVVLMLSNSNTDGPQPKQPIFTFHDSVSPLKPQFVSSSCSTNVATITMMIEGR